MELEIAGQCAFLGKKVMLRDPDPSDILASIERLQTLIEFCVLERHDSTDSRKAPGGLIPIAKDGPRNAGGDALAITSVAESVCGKRAAVGAVASIGPPKKICASHSFYLRSLLRPALGRLGRLARCPFQTPARSRRFFVGMAFHGWAPTTIQR